MFKSNLEVLNYQIEYFSRPGAQLAKTENGVCSYLDETTGDKCAIGCLLEEEEYWRYDFYKFEGDTFNDDMYYLLVNDRIISRDVEKCFLVKTQDFHDVEANYAEELVNLLKDMRDNENY